MKSFKKIAVDQTREQRRRFVLRGNIRETIASLRPTLQFPAIGVALQCPAGIAMDTYPRPLAQGLTNLVLHAVKSAFEPAHRESILISARLVDDHEIVLECRDNGCGILEAVIERIFEPIITITTRRSAGGGGLGFHQAYNMMTRRLIGTNSARYCRPEGAVFRIPIPRTWHVGSMIANAMRVSSGGCTRES